MSMSPLPSSRGGALVVVLVVLLLFVAVLAGLQAFAVVQSGLATRSLAVDSARADYRRCARLALMEAFQAGLDAREPARVDSAVSVVLAALGCGEGKVLISRTQGAPDAGEFMPVLSRAPVIMMPASRELVLDFPALGLREGQLVELGEALRYTVSLPAPSISSEEGGRSSLMLGLRRVGVPVCNAGRCVYELPSEIGVSQAASPGGGSFSEGFGFTGGGIDASEGQGAGGSAVGSKARGLPYRYRYHASLAAAYARLFSTAGISRLRFAAGERGFVLVTGGRVATAESRSLVGLEETGAGAVRIKVDLSSVSLPGVLMVSVPDGSGVLELGDQGLGRGMAPLMVVAVGSPEHALRVTLSSCGRSVVLIGANILLDAAPGASWAGGVLLAPDSRFDAGCSGLRVAHLSCHAASAPAAGVVEIAGGIDAAASALYPRVQYAVAWEDRL